MTDPTFTDRCGGETTPEDELTLPGTVAFWLTVIAATGLFWYGVWQLIR